MEQYSGQADYLMPETLLIVDDDEINRTILNNIFSAFYSVEEAENGETGLEKIQKNPP